MRRAGIQVYPGNAWQHLPDMRENREFEERDIGENLKFGLGESGHDSVLAFRDTSIPGSGGNNQPETWLPLPG